MLDLMLKLKLYATVCYFKTETLCATVNVSTDETSPN